MNEGCFRKLYWGFFFTMIDFRIQGFDVLPDIVGYIFFALGLSMLAGQSRYFMIARNLNIPMLIISIFSIFERPAQSSGINFGYLGVLSIPIAIGSFILGLCTIYYLFMGIKELAQFKVQPDIYSEAEKRWKQFIYLQLAFILALVFLMVPALAILYIIVMLVLSIIYTVKVMGFMNICGTCL